MMSGFGKFCVNDEIKGLRKETRGHLHDLWEIAKAGNLNSLSGEDRWLAKVMLEHQDQYFNQFEIADLTYDHEYDVDSEENPFLHIMIHSAVERQLEAKDPIEAFQFYNSMRKKKVSRHDTIHLIGVIFAPLMIQGMQQRKDFDIDKYISFPHAPSEKRGGVQVFRALSASLLTRAMSSSV